MTSIQTMQEEHQQELYGRLPQENTITSTNVGEAERWLSALVGGALTIYGVTRLLTKPDWSGAALSILGGLGIYRGASGHSFLYQALGIVTVEQSPSTISSLPDHRGVKIRRRLTINRSSEDLYNFWYDVEMAPLYMDNIVSVTKTGDRTSHWMATDPTGKKSIEWNSEILQDIPNKRIAWHVHGNSIAGNAGQISFEADPAGRGTLVTLECDFFQLKGPLGISVGKMAGHLAELAVQKNLRQFKELMETDEIATIKGQPTGKGRK